MRQMEKSHKDFLDWRKEREKEVLQLRRQVCSESVLRDCLQFKDTNIDKQASQCVNTANCSPGMSVIMQPQPRTLCLAHMKGKVCTLRPSW